MLGYTIFAQKKDAHQRKILRYASTPTLYQTSLINMIFYQPRHRSFQYLGNLEMKLILHHISQR